MDGLVTTDWLAGELGADDLRVVDATLLAADSGRDAAQEFAAGHIPGAVFLDLATLVDGDAALPNTLPPADTFVERMRALGIEDGGRIVLYDDSAWHTAGRAWFLLRTFGASDVAILDGGIAKWKAEGRALETGRSAVPRGHFTAWENRTGVRDLAQMEANLGSNAEQVLDARSAARFTGEAPDPHAGAQPGHIPGSKNLPVDRLFNADGTWKQGDALRAEFQQAGVDLGRPLVTTCGSGITASALAFGAHLLGNEAAVYDGSWSEWGADPDTPKATGAA